MSLDKPKVLLGPDWALPRKRDAFLKEIDWAPQLALLLVLLHFGLHLESYPD